MRIPGSFTRGIRRDPERETSGPDAATPTAPDDGVVDKAGASLVAVGMSRYEQRERLVVELYRLTSGDPSVHSPSDTAAAAAGISSTETPRVVEAAVARGWVDYSGEVGKIALTVDGAAFAAALLEDERTRDIAVIVSPLERAQLEPLLAAVYESAPSGNVSDADIDDIYAQVATARAQLRSPRPRRPILQETLRTVQAIGEGAEAEATVQAATAALRIVTRSHRG